MTERWIWVSLPYATFGLTTAYGVVVQAAPIAQWAVGQCERKVADYFRRKGAIFKPPDPWERYGPAR